MDLTGARFGRLLVQSRHPENAANRSIQWVCICDCGNTKITPADYLRTGRVQSCGCLQSENGKKTGSLSTHGMHGTSEYMAWVSMRQRCNNPAHRHYSDYGGRGIKVCPEWDESFEAFHQDMGDKPNAGLSLERKENDKGYVPGNCVWATATEQASNRRSSLEFELDGKKVGTSELAAISGVSEETIRKRLNRGDTIERAIRPVTSRKKD